MPAGSKLSADPWDLFISVNSIMGSRCIQSFLIIQWILTVYHINHWLINMVGAISEVPLVIFMRMSTWWHSIKCPLQPQNKICTVYICQFIPVTVTRKFPHLILLANMIRADISRQHIRESVSSVVCEMQTLCHTDPILLCPIKWIQFLDRATTIV